MKSNSFEVRERKPREKPLDLDELVRQFQSSDPKNYREVSLLMTQLTIFGMKNESTRRTVQRLLDPYLRGKDFFLCWSSLDVLWSSTGCTLAREYAAEIEDFIQGVEWDNGGKLRESALQASETLIAEPEHRDLLRVVFDLFKNSPDVDRVKATAYDALSESVGVGSYLLRAHRENAEFNPSRDVDPAVIKTIECRIRGIWADYPESGRAKRRNTPQRVCERPLPEDDTTTDSDWYCLKAHSYGLTSVEFGEVDAILRGKEPRDLANGLLALRAASFHDASVMTQFRDLVEPLLGLDKHPAVVSAALSLFHAWGLDDVCVDAIEACIDNTDGTNDEEGKDLRTTGLSRASLLIGDPARRELLRKVYDVFRDETEKTIVRRIAYHSLAESLGENWLSLLATTSIEAYDPVEDRMTIVGHRDFHFIRDVDPEVIKTIERRIRGIWV